MNKTGTALTLIALYCFLGCEGPEGTIAPNNGLTAPTTQELKGGMKFRLRANEDDMSGVSIQILKNGAMIKEKYIELELEPLPANLSPDGVAGHRFGDAYFVIAAGEYTIKATPLKSPTEPSATCLAAEHAVAVAANETKEVVLISRCDWPDNGGLDVIVTTNHDPVITDLVFHPSKFILTCEQAKIKVQAEDAENDPMTYEWTVVAKPEKAEFELTPVDQELTFLSRTAGDYTLKVKVCDSGNLCTSLTFPIHVSMSHDANANGIGDECEAPATPKGRIVTLMLTLSGECCITHPDKDIKTILAANTVQWVSPVAKPSIVVVRDDNHQGEHADDPAFIVDLLQKAGFAAVLLEEPADGLTEELVKDFQVVWMSNPGHEVDDLATIEVLQKVAGSGRGVVLQGDDMSHRAEMLSLTHLTYVHDGVNFCGAFIDDDMGKNYQVTVEADAHPVIKDLEGLKFLYGDDIDMSTPLAQGERVLAWATLNPTENCNNRPCPKTPVIIALDLDTLPPGP